MAHSEQRVGSPAQKADQDRDLLERYNPILIAFPQSGVDRSRPGERAAGRLGWGDYHPMSAELFYSRAQVRPRRIWFINWMIGVLEWIWPARETNERRRERALCEPCRWELDLARVGSTDPEGAWVRTLALGTGAPVVYGRIQDNSQSGHRFLQYWYFYPYNDFDDLHEGDWEVVVVRLGDGDTPEMVAASNHLRPLLAEWDLVRKKGTRPVIYVSRGSHAGYFMFEEFRDPETIMPPIGGRVVRALTRTLRAVRRFRGPNYDFLPADPKGPEGATAAKRFHGVRLKPTLVALDLDARPEWLDFRGWWGSTRSLSKGPSSPWAPCRSISARAVRLEGYERARWEVPWDWMEKGVWWSPTRTAPAGNLRYW